MNRIISLRSEGWTHRSNLTPSLFIGVSVRMYQSWKVNGHVYYITVSFFSTIFN